MPNNVMASALVSGTDRTRGFRWFSGWCASPRPGSVASASRQPVTALWFYFPLQSWPSCTSSDKLMKSTPPIRFSDRARSSWNCAKKCRSTEKRFNVTCGGWESRRSVPGLTSADRRRSIGNTGVYYGFWPLSGPIRCGISISSIFA